MANGTVPLAASLALLFFSFSLGCVLSLASLENQKFHRRLATSNNANRICVSHVGIKSRQKKKKTDQSCVT